jgi:hypothetical protein
VANTGDRAECPACLSMTAAVAAAQDARQPCPHCHLPYEVIGFVQDARNQLLPGPLVDALIEYSREAVVRGQTLTRIEGELRDKTREASEHKHRADTGFASLREEQERADRYRESAEADLARVRWRLAHVRSEMTRAFDEPYPESLR